MSALRLGALPNGRSIDSAENATRPSNNRSDRPPSKSMRSSAYRACGMVPLRRPWNAGKPSACETLPKSMSSSARAKRMSMPAAPCGGRITTSRRVIVPSISGTRTSSRKRSRPSALLIGSRASPNARPYNWPPCQRSSLRTGIDAE